MANHDDIRRILKLASLSISSNESEKLMCQVENIIDWVEQISKIDTTGVEPLVNPLQEVGFLNSHNDEHFLTNNSEDVIANAPQATDGFFDVPKVISSS